MAFMVVYLLCVEGVTIGVLGLVRLCFEVFNKYEPTQRCTSKVTLHVCQLVIEKPAVVHMSCMCNQGSQQAIQPG